MDTKKYNTTQLDPDTSFERHVYHRDQFAHFLRWTHVLKRMKIGMNVLDFGCGTSMNLAEVMYRNRYKARKYQGLDIRNLNPKGKKLEEIEWIRFNNENLVNMKCTYGNDWDLITSFEVIEHVGKSNANKFLQNIKKHCNKDTIVLISTPNFDEKVGAAGNHTYDCGDGNGNIPQEFTFSELKDILQTNGFKILEKYGTFTSQRDYKPLMNVKKKCLMICLNIMIQI